MNTSVMGINSINTKEGFVEVFLRLNVNWYDPSFFNN